MGAGIAALAAVRCKVLYWIFLMSAKRKNIIIKRPMMSNLENIKYINVGSFENDFHRIAEYDWICEAVVENLDIKKKIFSKIEKYRNRNSIVSSNTSGIPLKEITRGMPESLLKDVCITHFFNPVNVMRLCDLYQAEKRSH